MTIELAATLVTAVSATLAFAYMVYENSKLRKQIDEQLDLIAHIKNL